jgi:hypothetical protein
MTKPATRHVVTANLLRDGSVTYLTADRRWAPGLGEARFHDDAGARDAELAWARKDEAHVCNAYAFEVAVHADGSLGLSARERFRRDGAGAARARLGY